MSFQTSQPVCRTLGELRFEEVVGSGSFATVYRAHSTIQGKPVAVKEVSAKTAQDRKYVEQEIEALKLLAQDPHPNIVPFHGHIYTEDTALLIMDLIEGRDLYYALSQRRDGFSCAETKRMMLNILQAVKHCHDRGVYVRDVKPENILLDSEDCVYLCDFGLSTFEAVTTKKNVGTFSYMCPEMYYDAAQIMSVKPVSSCRQDLWSLVILLFNIRFAAHPWDIASIEEDEHYEAFVYDPWTLADRFGASEELVDLMASVCIFETIGTVDDFIAYVKDMEAFVDPAKQGTIIGREHRLWMDVENSSTCDSYQPNTGVQYSHSEDSPDLTNGDSKMSILLEGTARAPSMILSPVGENPYLHYLKSGRFE